jgi:hypothetical protein
MKTDDLENELRNLKFTHLTDSELAAYDYQQLEQIDLARVEAHLKQCFICERQFELLREESSALNNHVVTAEDVAFVGQLTEQTVLTQQSSVDGRAETARELPWRERLAEYLRQLVAIWQVSFEPRRRDIEGEEVWRWESEDGRLQVRATMEKNADMIVHFSSNEMELDGARLLFRLGLLSQELTLRRISESEVAARVAIPWPYRQGNMMADISIEIV